MYNVLPCASTRTRPRLLGPTLTSVPLVEPEAEMANAAVATSAPATTASVFRNFIGSPSDDSKRSVAFLDEATVAGTDRATQRYVSDIIRKDERNESEARWTR